MSKPDFKQKSAGYFISAAAAVIGLVTAVMYLVFGISSGTLSAGILVCLLVGTVAGIVAMFYEGLLTDVLVLAMAVLFAVALGLLVPNSAGDFTEFLTPVGMYGNAANMGMRFTLAALMGVGMIVGIVGCFLSRKKKA